MNKTLELCLWKIVDNQVEHPERNRKAGCKTCDGYNEKCPYLVPVNREVYHRVRLEVLR